MDKYKAKGNLIEYVLNYLNVVDEKCYNFEQNADSETALEVMSFMDEIPGGFLIYRADGKEEIIYANTALINIFKCDSLQEFRELTDNSFKGLVYYQDLDVVEESISNQIESNADNLDFVEYRIKRKDGAIRWVEDYGHFISSKAVGNIFYVFISDVTEEKERRLAETAAIVNEKDLKIKNLTEEFDKELKLINQEHLRRLEVIEGLSVNYDSILYVDLSADKLLPYRASSRMKDEFEEMYMPRDYCRYIKRYINAWVIPEDRELVEKSTSIDGIIEGLTENKTFFINYRIKENNAICHMQIRVVNVGSREKISQVVIGARNIEDDIKRDIKHMQVLEEALSASKLANVAKNTFLSNMSHDMRTPLNAIFGYTALAKNCVDEPTKVYLDKIDDSANQLLELIDKVLQISQIESSDSVLNESECNVCEILNKVNKEVLRAASEKNIRVTTDFCEVKHKNVVCDCEKLEQTLLHILSNAVKYSHVDGTVKISVCETQELPNGYSVYRFDVEDNGIGIDSDALTRIFEPFERVKNTTFSRVYGTGLGLTISKKYVDAMGGNITVKSELGKGSIFSVTLNLLTQRDEQTIVATAEDLIRALYGKKILIVDDNEINLEIETEILSDLGFDIDTATDGDKAVEIMKSESARDYALVIMDIQMPVMDGRTATKHIRSLPDADVAGVPIIALSANAFESDKKLSLECGMDAHLTKPLDVPLLLKTVATIFSSRS